MSISTINGNNIKSNTADYGGGIWVAFYDDYIDDYRFYLQIEGEYLEDTGDFNTICGNSPKQDQLNYTNYYPNNYISDICD